MVGLGLAGGMRRGVKGEGDVILPWLGRAGRGVDVVDRGVDGFKVWVELFGGRLFSRRVSLVGLRFRSGGIGGAGEATAFFDRFPEKRWLILFRTMRLLECSRGGRPV
jgi:hypothetical protein